MLRANASQRLIRRISHVARRHEETRRRTNNKVRRTPCSNYQLEHVQLPTPHTPIPVLQNEMVTRRSGSSMRRTVNIGQQIKPMKHCTPRIATSSCTGVILTGMAGAEKPRFTRPCRLTICIKVEAITITPHLGLVYKDHIRTRLGPFQVHD